MVKLLDGKQAAKNMGGSSVKPGSHDVAYIKPDSENQTSCPLYGYVHPSWRCPAYGKTCAKCQGCNHFAKVCKVKSKDVVAISETNVDDSEFMIGSVHSVNSVSSDWVELVNINGCVIPCKLDTGAQVFCQRKTTEH